MFDVYVLERIFRLSIFKPGRVCCWFVVLLCVVCLRFMFLFCTNNFENIFVATKLYFIKVTSGQGQLINKYFPPLSRMPKSENGCPPLCGAGFLSVSAA